MQTVKLKTNTSMIEVNRRFRNSKATILKAQFTPAVGDKKTLAQRVTDDDYVKPQVPYRPEYWSILFLGEPPDLYGLTA
jgi:hypothetical protein